MRVLGVDFNVGFGNKNGQFAMCVLDNASGENKVISMFTGDADINTKKMAEAIISTFKNFCCDYIAVNPSGVMAGVIEILKNELGDSIKDEFINSDGTHAMINMLQKDKVLKRVGLELKVTNYVAGKMKFDTDNTEDLEMTMIYSIGLANKVLNNELNGKKNELLQKLKNAQETINDLTEIISKITIE